MSNLNFFENSYIERVENACRDLASGKGVILVDDESRENEGDIIFAAEHLSVTQMNQLIQDCSGIVCLCMPKEQAQHLNLQPMVKNNTSANQTAFTVSIEAKEGVTTGVSAHDRWVTIQTAIKDGAVADDLCQPGHIFPIIAHRHGVVGRRGHTEGSVDLMKLADIKPFAVICELINSDGSMKKLPEIIDYAQQHAMCILSVEDIYQYRVKMDLLEDVG